MGSHCELVINQSTRLETRSLQVAWKLISAYLALGGSLSAYQCGNDLYWVTDKYFGESDH